MLWLNRDGKWICFTVVRSSLRQPTIVPHHPNCRTIRLNAGPAKFIGRDDLFDYLPEFVRELENFQKQQGYYYPLIHTNYWLSAWVGMELRKSQPLLQVHTYHSLGAIKYRTMGNVPAIAIQRLAVEKTCLETVDCVVATSPRTKAHADTGFCIGEYIHDSLWD